MALAGRRPLGALADVVLGPVPPPRPSLREELRHLQEEASAARVQVRRASGAGGPSLLEELESRQKQLEDALAQQDRQMDRALLAAGILLASLAALYALLVVHLAGP